MSLMIEVKNLNVAINRSRILSDINLFVGRGETLSIMGPSGCGKTTLLKTLIGLIRPTSGEVYVDEEPIERLNEKGLNRIRLKMGLVFQYAALFDFLSVEDNVKFGLIRHSNLPAAEIHQSVVDNLKLVGLEGSEKKFPSQLSGGMRKRVGLARALALKPLALLYDEPTSGLDPVTAYTIDRLIVELHDELKVTSIVVSHDVNSVFRVSDRILVLSEGKIAAVGTPDEIRKSEHPQVKSFLQTSMATSVD